MGPLNSNGKICGIDTNKENQYLYPVTLDGLGNCLSFCPFADVPSNTTDPNDYECLDIPELVSQALSLPNQSNPFELFIFSIFLPLP